jgi:hypothetical protein
MSPHAYLAYLVTLSRSDELLTAMFKAVVKNCHVDPALIEDICVGTVLPPRAPYEARYVDNGTHSTCI